ncbi:MAG: methylamine utilization protein MauG, partial [Gammaproteobacteria bacterium]|nr:methylamine utilization protein MauG [Gammaproteobacteria bacterium]
MKHFNFSLSQFDYCIAICLLFVLLLSGCGSNGSGDNSDEGRTSSETTSELAALGREIYFDENLSNPVGQSCASCHLPTAGFADPDSNFPVSEGAVTGRFGARNAPTASYAAFIPEFRFVFGGGGGHYEGGQFWDGRASTLELQAQGPFLGILEMNMTDKDAVIEQLRISTYANEFAAVFGDNALDDVDQAYQQISQAIAEFERSSFFSPFSSKFDAVMAGTEIFTLAEQ